MNRTQGTNAPRRRRALGLVGAALIALLVGVLLPSHPAHSVTTDRVYLIGPASELASLPTSGAAWTALVERADQPLVPNLADQDNKSPAYAFAAALVYARTGNTSYRDKVVTALRALPGTEYNTGARTLSVGRQIAGWVLAADLVDYREPSFVSWVAGIRTAYIGGHARWTTLVQTHETTSSNWGAFAGASRIAASLYVGDTADVARAVQVFRGWLGDTTSWPTLSLGQTGRGFYPTADFDPTWACQYPGWQPTDPACGDRNGALVEDISRGETYPNATQVGLSYSWEALQGATLQAILLGRNGYPDVWTWQSNALGRAVTFLATHHGFDDANFNAINHWVTQASDQVYGTHYSTHPAGNGREFGYTDWLRVTPIAGSSPTSSTSTTTAPSTTTTAPSTTTTAAPTTTTAPSTTTTTVPPASLTLSASVVRDHGQRTVQLRWSGAGTTRVDVWRNGSLRSTTDNDGFYADAGVRGLFTYQVCEAGTRTCSSTVTVKA